MLRITFYLPQEGSIPFVPVALCAASCFVQDCPHVSAAGLTFVHPFYPRSYRVWCRNPVRAVFFWRPLLLLLIKWKRPKGMKRSSHITFVGRTYSIFSFRFSLGKLKPSVLKQYTPLRCFDTVFLETTPYFSN